jgi:hypothetical protein
MGKGYAEGPAADEAERRREELASDRPAHKPGDMRLAVYGATAEDADSHFLGWLGEVDPDELFSAGSAWGITVVRRPV